MTYRDDLAAAQARIQALERELAETRRERDQAVRERDLARTTSAAPPPAPRPRPAPAPEPVRRPPPVRPGSAALERLRRIEGDHSQKATQENRLALARTLVGVGEWDRARHILEQALEHGFQGTGVTRGDVYLELGKIEAAHTRSAEALAYYQRGLRHEPNHAGLNAALVALARS